MIVVKVTIRGEEVEVADVSFFEDMSVGIPLHLEDFRLVRADGTEVDCENLTDDELDAINTAVFDAERAAYHEEDGQ